MKNTTLITIVVTGVAIGVVGFATAQSRQPTKGYVPDKAFENGRINIDDVPDYFIAYARNGEVAGYIRKGD
ncbi:MAG TPA: hypothetical protein VFS24_20955, partial [Steroidobacteraceae bacterium]|nr:hypothetical protein [Steroidobacteraceae bacterium]